METSHRQLVQYLLKNGIITMKKAIHLCNKTSDTTIENDCHIRQIIETINPVIKDQHFKIIFTTCEVKNKNVLVWINTKSDDISKRQLAFKSIHLEYFYKILNEILDSPDFKITSIAALNLTCNLTTVFSIESGQTVLQKWIDAGYYVQLEDFIYLGPRLIQEFNSYLKSQCPEQSCKLCSELVFVGSKCRHCGEKLHTYCINMYLRTQKKCPQCSNIWDIE